MESSLASLGVYIPRTAAELFGTAALCTHLVAYGVYARDVFSSRIRPNLISWLMWLFGGLVELFTYNAIENAHWSTSTLPFACVVGIGGICIATLVAQAQAGRSSQLTFYPPERVDYFMVSFDVVALFWWLVGNAAAFANFFAVGTSVITFIPIWRTTYKNPEGEHSLPWILWSVAYLFMFMAVLTSEGSGNAELYFYPVYYFVLHVVMVFLCLRKQTRVCR